ncbi:unnamed protein product, partial [Tenebrio molitor]
LFHQQIQWVVVVAQAFGLLPVQGVTSENCDNLTFRWYSPRAFYSEVIIFGCTINAIISFCRTIYAGFTLHHLSSFIFNANSAVGGIIFFNLAKNWPQLIKNWSQVESSLDNWHKRPSLKRKFYTIITIVMVAAIVEHLLSIVHVCSQIPYDDPDKFVAYFSRNYPHLFDFFEFSTPLAIFAVVMSICNVFSWNFLDAFLIIMSIALTQKFEQVTSRVLVAYNTKSRVSSLDYVTRVESTLKMRLIRKMRSDLALTIEPDMVLAYPQSSFQETFSFVLVFGQFFGIMPLHGMTRKNVQEVQFKWKSIRLVYAVYNFVGAFIMGVFCVSQFAIHGLMLDKTATMSFYILNFFAALQFIIIATNWSKVLKEWSFIDMSMRGYGAITNMKRRFVVMTTVIMTLALVEHLLFITNALTTGDSCGNYTLYTPDKVYFQVAFPSVFTLIDYSPWKACLVEIANVLSTVTWNYTDLFIILISCSLSARFAQINRRLANNKVMHEKFWKEIREDYTKLAHLTQVVDKHIAALVTISFVSNAFFICVQLYNSLKERVGTVETVYYFYSFGFLVARTIAVTLYGAWINDESRKPLQILHSVPSEHYCREITRLIQQINASPAGITGSRFFMITRSFFLKVN